MNSTRHIVECQFALIKAKVGEITLSEFENQDLDAAIKNFENEPKTNRRSLEEYLRALLLAAEQFSKEDTLPANLVDSLLATAFISDMYDFDSAWGQKYEQLLLDEPGFAGWRSVLIQQIVDLREMEAMGTLADTDKYFGVDSPRGSRWYNFDPVGYLECATAGTFLLWQEESRISMVSWEDLKDFIECGRLYE